MSLITMRHPDIEGSSVQVTKAAFERAYKPKGWVVAATDSPSTALDKKHDEPEKGRFPTRKEK